MSTQLRASQTTPISSETRESDTVIPLAVLAYFRGRFTNNIHELVLTEFATLEREGKTSRAEIARKIRKKPEQITRWLGSPGNWTLETVSDLLLGLGLEPAISVRSIESEHAESWNAFYQAGGDSTIVVHMQSAQEVARDIADGNHKPFYFTIGVSSGSTTIESIPPSEFEKNKSLPGGISMCTYQGNYLNNRILRIAK